MNRKTSYLASNLVAPGVGQLMAKKWMLGGILFITGQACALWILWEIIYPWYMIMQDALNDKDINLSIFNLKRLVLAFSLLAITWLISFADLYFMKKK
ncbi:MAG TPA: hypothetical protein DET40_25340 [Lentisphaeria bacterium]|nr:MAG: hypothetical protein A2X45_18625 [Lentisphaerae bacterium GWF2_50_93]HCE46886.1 hypothetical protein [Lentisphaeria bacterium]